MMYLLDQTFFKDTPYTPVFDKTPSEYSKRLVKQIHHLPPSRDGILLVSITKILVVMALQMVCWN